MSLDEGVSRLIGRIYDGAEIGTPAWRQALDGVLDRTGGRFALVSVVDTRDSRLSQGETYGVEDARFIDRMRDYVAFQHRSDPTLRYALANPGAGFVSLAMVAGGRDYAAHPYSRWMRDALGSGGCAVRYTQPVDGLAFAVSINTPVSRPVQSDAELRLFLLLFDHMERAMRIAARPPDLSSRGEPVFLLNGAGRVSALNEAAEALLALGDGIAIRGARLRLADPHDDRRLDVLLKSALGAVEHGGTGGAMRVARLSGKPAWLLRVAPLPRPESPFAMFRPAAIVQVFDPAARIPGMEARLSGLFGLTPAECLVAAHLRRGLADEEIARRLNRSIATVRSHVKAILAKTELNGRAELAHLLTLF